MKEEVREQRKTAEENEGGVSTWIDQQIAPMVPRTFATMGISIRLDERTRTQGTLEQLNCPSGKQKKYSGRRAALKFTSDVIGKWGTSTRDFSE
jgi:hypothetical protein